VSAAENSYAAERSYKTGLPLSHKKNYIIIYNLLNVLTRLYIHVAINLMNKSESFHGKHQILWVTPNFESVVNVFFFRLLWFLVLPVPRLLGFGAVWREPLLPAV